MGCCASFSVASSGIEAVKYVPGVPHGDSPGFIQKFAWWRKSCLRVVAILGVFYVLAAAVYTATEVVNIKKKFNMFPDNLREHFTYFVYARTAAEVFTQLCSIIAIFYMWQAYMAMDDYWLSKSFAVKGWIIMFLGPFLPALLVPYGSVLRTELVQRDLCSTTLVGMLMNSVSRLGFQTAALSVGEVELADLAGRPLLNVGDVGYEASPNAQWCLKNHKNWEEIIFSTAWVRSSTDYMKAIAVPGVGDPGKPGVVPQSLKVLTGMLGIPWDAAMRFCHTRDEVTQKDLESVSSASLMAKEQTEKTETAIVRREPTHRVRNRVLAEGGIEGGRLAREVLFPEFMEGKEDAGNSISPEVAKALGKSSLCAGLKAATAALRAGRMSGVIAVNMTGSYSMLLCFKDLFLSIFSIIDGLIMGVVNVKMVLHNSSLPGYLLVVAVIAVLPPTFFTLAILNQLVAHPCFAISTCSFAAVRAIDIWKAHIMIDTRRPHRLMKEFSLAVTWQNRLKILGLLGVVAYIGRMVVLIDKGDVIASQISTIPNLDLRSLFDPAAMVCMIVKFLAVRVVTLSVTTDIVLEAVFDAADDKLKVETQRTQELIVQWTKMTGASGKKGKHGKKHSHKEEDKDPVGDADGIVATTADQADASGACSAAAAPILDEVPASPLDGQGGQIALAPSGETPDAAAKRHTEKSTDHDKKKKHSKR